MAVIDEICIMEVTTAMKYLEQDQGENENDHCDIYSGSKGCNGQDDYESDQSNIENVGSLLFQADPSVFLFSTVIFALELIKLPLKENEVPKNESKE